MRKRERMFHNSKVQYRKERILEAADKGNIIGGSGSPVGKGNSSGWGVGNPDAKPATGQKPFVDPFLLPKPAGLTHTSQTYPGNYFVEWTPATWRIVCDQVINQGYTYSYATLVSWVIQSSPFVRSLIRAIESPIGKIPYIAVNKKGSEYPEWTAELCNKGWTKKLRKKIGLADFMGFSGLNFDPILEKLYKYPMQDIDPISRMLRSGTFNFYDGISFSDNANLLFVQHDTDPETFLGWMQTIARSYIQINVNKSSWINAGRRLAFPMLAIGYPQADGSFDPTTNQIINQYKFQAESIAANLDTSKALVYPYTVDEKGNVIKSIQVDFESTGTGAKAHDIFSDFNDAEKDEIREFILGGVLTSNVSKYGNRSLGEVHADKLETVILDIIEDITAYQNDEWIPKISQFYKNFPADLQLIPNISKQLSIEDIKVLADVLKMNGKKLTDKFFILNGLSKDFFEDDNTVNKTVTTQDDDTEYAAAIPSKSLLTSKKKF